MSPKRYLSWAIWLVPLAAALIGIGILVRTLAAHGPSITVSFLTAEGLEAGRTTVRYRDVDVGTVENIRLAADRSRVLVDIQLASSTEGLANASSRFWVVRPRVGLSGISGLNTVLSGAYIGIDPGRSAEPHTQFIGLEIPPAVTSDQHGRRFVLQGDELGSVEMGSPVYFRHIQVGRVVACSLDKNGDGVTVQVFVDAPYDQYVRAGSRWWQASGVDLRLDSAGMKLNTQSLATVLTGGLAFQTPPDAPPETEAADGAVFRLAGNEEEAMHKLDGPPAKVVMIFNQSLRGLAIGAPVDFRGIELGYVTGIDIQYDPVHADFKMPVTLNLYPNRLGGSFMKSVGEGDSDAGRELLSKLIDHGLRGQLRTGNLLTNQRYIALETFPNAAPVKMDWNRQPLELPTVPNTLDELQVQMGDIARKLDRVPFDQIGNNLNETLKRANSVFEQLDTQLGPQARETLSMASETFRSARDLMQQDSPLQSDMHQAVSQLNRTLQSLNDLAEYLQEHPESLLRGKPKDSQP